MKVLGSILWVLFSVVMIVGGIFGCFTPLETLASLAFLLPILLIVSGVANIAYYFDIKAFDGAKLVLVDGILSIVFALIFLLSGVEFTSLTIVAFVAFMTMFKGILGISYSFDIKKLGSSSWVWVLVFSIINIIIAVIFIAFPQVGGITIGIMISLLILMFGIVSLLSWWGVKATFGN